ncbi:Uncharacterized protein BM_BM421 [Brugia malayi]|uniref:Bm421 n=1 Tax=Brugia malayi TaxID=6279 RepID=A0A0K0JDN7_BRUMA|nr:Uncharacterized protein BM_BM421 [Brugia malayi]CRZ23815.1 Bm421 [Brugia malayi]VIO86993.1 Uncharacterized protein BM_BM421 [Brugia malayi]
MIPRTTAFLLRMDNEFLQKLLQSRRYCWCHNLLER